jgi:hypothetical protein
VVIDNVEEANALMTTIITGVQKAFGARAAVDAQIAELTLEEMKAFNVKQTFYRAFFSVVE